MQSAVSMPPQQCQSAVNPLYSSQQLPQPYGNPPQYQTKKGNNFLVGIIAGVVLVVVLAVVIVIATSPSDSGPEPEPSFDDIVYRRVSMKLEGEEVAFDYETGLWQHSFPPKNAEKVGTKTVSGRQCQLYQSSAHYTVHGDTVPVQFHHCVADRFVLETEVDVEGELSRHTFSDHKKLSEDDSFIDVDGLCPSVEPSFDDIVYRRVSVKFDDFDSDDFEFALDYKTGVFSVKDEDATWLVDTMAALDYQKSSGLDICYTSEIDDDMGLYMMAVFLPPKNAEKIGTKTVSGRECQQYESFSTFDLFGDSYTFRFVHCVADRFVLETEEFLKAKHIKVCSLTTKDCLKMILQSTLKVSVYQWFMILYFAKFFFSIADPLFNGTIAFDYDAMVMYWEYPEAEVIMRLDGSTVDDSIKFDGEEQCLFDSSSDLADTEMFHYFLPPTDAEFIGMSDDSSIYRSSIPFEGTLHQLDWYVRDRFVLKIVDGTYEEYFESQQVVSPGLSVWDESQLCSNLYSAETLASSPHQKKSLNIKSILTRLMKKHSHPTTSSLNSKMEKLSDVNLIEHIYKNIKSLLNRTSRLQIK
ncbi:hypothetical protein GEMRC1_010594 [Eukaryota sp. GEM-RC1]